MSNLDGCCDTPDCLMCEWTVESVLRHTRRLLDALIADVPSLRLELWTPTVPYRENRRLPLRLEDV